jgi:hypothetical protein
MDGWSFSSINWMCLSASSLRSAAFSTSSPQRHFCCCWWWPCPCFSTAFRPQVCIACDMTWVPLRSFSVFLSWKRSCGVWVKINRFQGFFLKQYNVEALLVSHGEITFKPHKKYMQNGDYIQVNLSEIILIFLKYELWDFFFHSGLSSLV